MVSIRTGIQVLFAAGYLIYGVYGHFIDTKNLKLPGLAPPKDPNLRVLDIDSFEDYIYATLYTGLFYLSKYYLLAQYMESTNPIPKTEYRVRMTKKQRNLGIWALTWVIVFTTFWMWKIEPLTPYYGYYQTHDLTLKDFFLSLFFYMFCFDTWFFFTHLALHHPALMRLIHYHHHEFVEPTAFGQDAVHPIEALIQGPIGHFLCTLFYPIHPVCSIVFGLATSVWALCAHDGRGDLNGHNKHHQYVDCNYSIYWGFWDYIFGKRYSKKRFPVEYVWHHEKIAKDGKNAQIPTYQEQLDKKAK